MVESSMVLDSDMVVGGQRGVVNNNCMLCKATDIYSLVYRSEFCCNFLEM